MKLCRSRCSGVLEKPAGVGELLVSGEHLWTFRHCPETPERNDQQGKCKVCAAAVSYVNNMTYSTVVFY
jgi:hypothetical protein